MNASGHAPKHKVPPHPTSWLWKFAICVIFVGTGIALLCRSKFPDPHYIEYFRLTITITALITGICLICCSANWWVKR